MDSLLVAVLGLVAQIAGVAYWLGRKLSSLESRQTALESRLADLKAYVDGRFSELKAYVDYVNKEFKAYVDGKFSEVDRRFSEVEEGLEELEGGLKVLEEGLEELEGGLSRGLSLVSSAALAMNALVVDFAALKGLFTEEERDYLKAQLSSMASMARLNPITEEEAEFVRRVVSKPEEEITEEELDKLVEIAKRYFFENPSELSAKFFHYAYAYRAALLHERRKRRSEATKG